MTVYNSGFRASGARGFIPELREAGLQDNEKLGVYRYKQVRLYPNYNNEAVSQCELKSARGVMAGAGWASHE